MTQYARDCIKVGQHARHSLAGGGRPVEGCTAGGTETAMLLHVCRIGWTDRGRLVMSDGEDELEFGVPLLVGFATPQDAPPAMLRFERFLPEVAMALVGPVDPSGNRRIAQMGVIFRRAADGTPEVTALAWDDFDVDAGDPDSLTIAYGTPGYVITMTGIGAPLARPTGTD